MLDRLQGVSDRSAAFVCVACLFNPKTLASECFTGTIEGTIANALSGSDGFGYDPIFIPNGYTQSFAELGQTIKNTLSHRRKALQLMEMHIQKNPNFFDL